jgi:hypothetical protein
MDYSIQLRNKNKRNHRYNEITQIRDKDFSHPTNKMAGLRQTKEKKRFNRKGRKDRKEKRLNH